MPYTMENIPDRIKGLPKHAQEIFIAAFNSAWKQYDGDEEKCNATAIAAVKTKYEQNEKGEWLAKKDSGQTGMTNHTEWIPIFRTGTHTDSAGNTKTWTDQELDHIVSAYNPAKHEAPVVIGHPKDNAPAYGWVEKLKREGEMLYMKMKDIIPAFADMIAQKMFKKRSISLYPDGTLRHVGWLGAMPPAVKGLPDIQFKNEGGETTIEFEEAPEKNLKEEKSMSFWERLKKRMGDAGISFAELFGSETPPTLFTEADIKTKIDAGIADALKAKEAEFSEAAKKREEDLKKREIALRTQEADAKKAAIASFCEDMKKKGILIPAMDKLGMGITEFMSQIASIETPIEFGEEGKKEKQTPLEFMQSFLSKLPKAIEFREVAGNDKDAGRKGNAGEKIEALVKEKMKANKAIAYGAAFAEVQMENPELAQEYAEELRG